MGRVICSWYEGSELKMSLKKHRETIYTLNNKIIDYKTANKICSLNYQNAINLLKENDYGEEF